MANFAENNQRHRKRGNLTKNIMKRLTFILSVLLVSFCAFAEDDLTGMALSMRTQISSVLRGEGYSPSVDSDGDIAFRYEGSSYYISCENYNDEVYVRVFRDITTSDYNDTVVRRAADIAQNEWKFVRSRVLDGFIRVECDVAVVDITEFQRRFSAFLSIIQGTVSSINENLY